MGAACCGFPGFELLPSRVAPIVFTASVSGLNESPKNTSPGLGAALLTIDDILNTMPVEATFADLMEPNTAAQIDVINGPGDANTSGLLGPVATTTPTFTGFPGLTTSCN